MTIEYSARSHMGKARENNEDNLFVDGIILPPNICDRTFAIDGSTFSPTIFAVCDGMGGEDKGEVASFLAVQILANTNEAIKSTALATLNEAVQLYVNKANEAIHAETGSYGHRTGTTLALAVSAKNGLYCFNIGDSRIYSLQRDVFRQITNDHTLAVDQMLGRYAAPNQAVTRNAGHKLTRCIGIGDALTIESYPLIAGECRILICSDGLTDMVSIAEIERVLRISERTADAANALLKAALENGGKDNVTLVVVDIKASKASFFHRLRKKLKG